METKKIIEILEKHHEYDKILSFVYSPSDKKFNIIYENIFNNKYIDIYEYSDYFKTFVYSRTNKLN